MTDKMGLTSDEIKYSERYLRRLERDSRQWPKMRWVMLIAAALLLGISAYSFTVLAKLSETYSSIFSIRSGKFDAKEVELFLNGQLTGLRLEIFYLLRITLQVAVGIVWLVYCLINWNHHIKSALMAKALRKLIHEE